MWTRLVFCVVCSLMWGALQHAPSARAQDASKAAAARSLFEEGVRESDAAQWDAAAQKFREALALRDSPVVRFNLAVALIELGQLVEATDLLRAVQRDTRTSSDIATRIPELLESAEKRLAHLTILVEGEGGEILLDERTLRSEDLGAPMALDPGTYTLRVQRGGEQLEARTLALASGDNAVVGLRIPALKQAEIADGPVLAGLPRSDATPDEHRRRRRLAWGIGAAAVAVAAGVLTGALLASRDKSGEPSTATFDPPTIGVRVPQ